MSSQAASGKSAASKPARSSASSTKAVSKRSASRTATAKDSGDTNTVVTESTKARGSGTRATGTQETKIQATKTRAKSSQAKSSQAKRTPTKKPRGAKTPGKTKRLTTKPEGPAVYVSDVVAAAKAAGRKSSAVLPATLEAGGCEVLKLSPIEADLPIERRGSQVLRLAEEAFAMTGSWVVFYRTMLAPKGVVDQIFDTKEARRYFETTVEFAELLEMVTAIRSQDDSSTGAHEPSRVITVRIPRSMHLATVREAEELELSINAYCLTKLLQPANPRFTPLESGGRRGRRPGPQVTMNKIKVKS